MDFAATNVIHGMASVGMAASSQKIESIVSPRLFFTLTIGLSCLTLAVAVSRAIVTCRRFRQSFQQSGEGNLCYRGVRYRGPSAPSPQVSADLGNATSANA